VLKVNGNEAASGVVPVGAPLGFTANDCLDLGIDLGTGAVQVQWPDRAGAGELQEMNRPVRP